MSRFAVLLASGLFLSGCGGLAFRVVQHVPPVFSLGRASEIQIVAPAGDARARQIAEALASRLRGAAPARVVSSATPRGGVVVVELSLARGTTTTPMVGGPSEATLGPTGSWYVPGTFEVQDGTVVRALLEVSARDATGPLGPAMRVGAGAGSDDPLTADLHVGARLVSEAERLFQPLTGEVVLSVEDAGDPDAQARLLAAIAEPSPASCLALEDELMWLREARARARALFTVGQCRLALALDPVRSGGIDAGELDRAQAVLQASFAVHESDATARALLRIRALRPRLPSRP